MDSQFDCKTAVIEALDREIADSHFGQFDDGRTRGLAEGLRRAHEIVAGLLEQRALREQLAVCVEVKPLVWEGDGHWCSGDNEGWMEEANTPFGWGYSVEFGRNGNFKFDSTFEKEEDGLETPDEAKAAAQADYERRILSTITTSPAAEVWAEGWLVMQEAAANGALFNNETDDPDVRLWKDERPYVCEETIYRRIRALTPPPQYAEAVAKLKGAKE